MELLTKKDYDYLIPEEVSIHDVKQKCRVSNNDKNSQYLLNQSINKHKFLSPKSTIINIEFKILLAKNI